MNTSTLIFFLLAAFILTFALVTVTAKRIIRAATALLLVLFGIAGLYFLMGYTFLGSVQIMVYAGGIVVLYVFSIFLTRGDEERHDPKPLPRRLAILASVGAGLALLILNTLPHLANRVADTQPSENLISIRTIGERMLSTGEGGYLLPFEAISVLLLACIVGGLLIARKR